MKIQGANELEQKKGESAAQVASAIAELIWRASSNPSSAITIATAALGMTLRRVFGRDDAVYQRCLDEIVQPMLRRAPLDFFQGEEE